MLRYWSDSKETSADATITFCDDDYCSGELRAGRLAVDRHADAVVVNAGSSGRDVVEREKRALRGGAPAIEDRVPGIAVLNSLRIARSPRRRTSTSTSVISRVPGHAARTKTRTACFAVYPQAKLDAIAQRLNTRPRLSLGFQTPAAKLAAIVASTN